NGLLQHMAIRLHRRRRVAHMVAQIQALEGPRADAAAAGRANRPHARRRGPVGNQPVVVHGRSAYASKSGQADGCAFWKASSFMQASNAAMVRGSPSKFTLKRWPLNICGTRQQSASVGVSPKQ